MRRFQLLSTAAFALVLVALGFSLWLANNDQNLSRTNRALVAQGEQAHVALCILRADLVRRAGIRKQFLLDNPEGVPGTTPESVRASIVAQEATIASLSVLRCS